MKTRPMLSTAIGAALALSGGVLLAKLLPATSLTHSQPEKTGSSEAKAPAAAEATPAHETALARAVRTETGAHRWLVVLATIEQAKAEDMPSIIRSVGDDSAMLRMVAAKWAELDPRHMFATLYADYLLPGGSPGALPSRWILTDVLFEEWGKKDMPGMVKALNEVPEFNGRDNLRMSVVNTVIKSDPELGLQTMKDWNIRNYLPDMKAVSEWAARDPRHAAEVVSKMGVDYAAQEALKQVGRAWAQKDPQEGLRYAATLSGGIRGTLAGEIVGKWAERDLAGAVKFATEQADSEVRTAMAQGLLKTWAKSDAAGALAWSQENLRGLVRAEAISELVKTAAEKDLANAGDLVASMTPGATQNRACASLFETWFNKGKDQREAALAWLADLPDPAARSAALERVQWNWVWNDPDAVRDFISGPYGHLASDSMVSQVARNQTAKNPEAALQWALGLPADRVAQARRDVLQQWVQIRPESAAAYAASLPPGNDRQNAITTVSQTLIFQAPDQALEWFGKLPSTDQDVVREIYAHTKLPSDRQAKLDKVLGKK